jgi:hypothetical protein
VSADDMPDGWEAAAMDGWNQNPAARAVALGQAAHDAYAEAVRRWKMSIAHTMATAMDVPAEVLVGQALPTWDSLAPELQNAWIAAAQAARDAD